MEPQKLPPNPPEIRYHSRIMTKPPPDLDRDQFERMLRNSPLLAGMEMRSRLDIATEFQAHPFRAGDTVVQAGGDDRFLGTLLDGEAIVQARSGSQAYAIAILYPGDIFGEIAFFDAAQTRTADIVATQDGVAAFLPHRVYAQLARASDPAAEILEKNVLNILAHRMKATNDRLAELLEASRKGGIFGALKRFFNRNT